MYFRSVHCVSARARNHSKKWAVLWPGRGNTWTVMGKDSRNLGATLLRTHQQITIDRKRNVKWLIKWWRYFLAEKAITGISNQIKHFNWPRSVQNVVQCFFLKKGFVSRLLPTRSPLVILCDYVSLWLSYVSSFKKYLRYFEIGK